MNVDVVILLNTQALFLKKTRNGNNVRILSLNLDAAQSDDDKV